MKQKTDHMDVHLRLPYDIIYDMFNIIVFSFLFLINGPNSKKNKKQNKTTYQLIIFLSNINNTLIFIIRRFPVLKSVSTNFIYYLLRFFYMNSKNKNKTKQKQKPWIRIVLILECEFENYTCRRKIQNQLKIKNSYQTKISTAFLNAHNAFSSWFQPNEN